MATIQGKIIQAFPPRSGQSAKGSWMAQDFLLESYDQPYTRKCLFSVWGEDRLKQFNIKEGDDLSVDIDVDAREYQGRYYNSVRAWRVTPLPANMIPQQPDVPGVVVPPPTMPVNPVSETPQGGDVTEDLPF